MKTLFPLFLAAACCAGTFAAPITYEINFDTSSGSPAPASGSFTYDPATGFSNFIVDWDNITFDLTSEVNAPVISKAEQGDCPGAAFNSAMGFSILGQQVTGCTGLGTYQWVGYFAADTHDPPLFGAGFVFGDLSGPISFSGGLPNDFAGIGIRDTITGLDPGTTAIAAGTWTITPESLPTPSASAVPEPRTFSMILFGAIILAANGRRPKAPLPDVRGPVEQHVTEPRP